MDAIINKRIAWIDVLRGLAIVFMIPANFSFLTSPFPMYFRILISYIAPTFIAVCAGMVVLNNQKHTLKYYIIRGGYIVFIGALIDIIAWNVFPFTEFDVLYVIGISLPFTYLLRNLNYKYLIILMLSIFFLAEILQFYYGYEAEYLEISLQNPYWPGLMEILHAFFIGGVFPIFPWFGFSLFGLIIFRYIFNSSDYKLSKSIIIYSCLLTTICYILLLYPHDLFPNIANGDFPIEREGSPSIFYPPSLLFMLSAIGAVPIIILFSQNLSCMRLSNVFAKFGQYSLLIYILHKVIGAQIIYKALTYLSINEIIGSCLFILVVLGVIFVLYLICLVIDRLKLNYKPQSIIMQLLIGK